LFEIVDVTIVNVALNNMRGSLGALTDAAWVITAYAIANVDCDSYDELVVNLDDEIILQFLLLFYRCFLMCGNANNIWN
jgi:DHA2 family multidrug resistance protein